MRLVVGSFDMVGGVDVLGVTSEFEGDNHVVVVVASLA